MGKSADNHYICLVFYPQIYRGCLLGGTFMVLLAGVSCKRVQDTTDSPEKAIPATMPKKVLKEKPLISIPEPVPVGHARVVVQVEKILPPDAGADTSLRRAMVRLTQIKGYGSSFNETLAVGQVLEVFFPMPLAGTDGKSGIQEGTSLAVELRAPQLGASRFTVSRFTKLP